MSDKSSQPHLTCDGQQLKVLAKAGLQWLQSNYQRVNELNVFPVPDGDTGTNMLATMQSALKDVEDDISTHVGAIANKIARGAMMGSRGNSGTILSQIWMGLGRVIENETQFDATMIAQALREATETAYRGVQRPVEGTILTVIREMTEEVEATVANEKNLEIILERMVKRGWDAVERTPEYLPVLKKAGVVDSGGMGLVYVVEGMLRQLRGEELVVVEKRSPEEKMADIETEGPQIEHPGENIYDVQFVVKGSSLNADTIKAAMERIGDSVVVVGTDSAVKVHVHVRNPGIPLEYGANVGPISDIVVENMLEQYYEYLQQRLGNRHTNVPEEAIEFRTIEPGQIAVVAVAAGRGMEKVLADLGVAAIVRGGQTNNPSTEEILKAIEPLSTDQVIILPNNKNIILSAEQAANLETNRQIRVIPTRTFPQGVSAMFAYQADGELDNVVEAMVDAKDDIITVEVTYATRSVELDGVNVTEGQVIGLINGQLNISGDDLETVVREALTLTDLKSKELITLYYGDQIAAADAHILADALIADFEDLEFDVVHGGQAHYPYIMSIE